MRQVRVDLTEREWIEVRKAALDADLPLHEFLARLIRENLGLEGRTDADR